MTNSELILRLVEMLLQEKEETMKAKEQQDKAKDECRNTQCQSKQGGFYGATLFFEQKNSMCIFYGYTYSKQITSSESKNNLFIVNI